MTVGLAACCVAAGALDPIAFILEKPDARFIPGAVFVPQNAGGNGWTIRNCRFGPNRARALILNASFGVVENCVFDRTEGQAIRASSSYPWLEGGCARNVTVRGCTFIDCNCYFGAVLGNGGTLPAASHREIAIEGNRFRGRSRVIVHGCTGLKIAGNTFDCEPEHSVELRNVADVSCSDSRSHVAAGIR